MLASASFDATVAIWERKDGGMHWSVIWYTLVISRGINHLPYIKISFPYIVMTCIARIISEIGQKFIVYSRMFRVPVFNYIRRS